MTSYNAFSYIPVMKTDFILKTSIDKKLCQDIIEVTKDKLGEDISDNLADVNRTIWELHTDEDAATFNAWVAHYKNESFVEPHCHTPYPGFYSCSLYLSTGGKDTSLSFLSDEAPSFNQNKLKIPCKEGDMLIFPSDLVHYTNDTFDERIILSANVYAGYSPNVLNQGNPNVEETTGES